MPGSATFAWSSLYRCSSCSSFSFTSPPMLGDGGALRLDGVVEQRLSQRGNGDLELRVVGWFGGDLLQPVARLHQRAAQRVPEMPRREADDLVSDAGDQRNEHHARAEFHEKRHGRG